jgi:hypothetical protein
VWHLRYVSYTRLFTYSLFIPVSIYFFILITDITVVTVWLKIKELRRDISQKDITFCDISSLDWCKSALVRVVMRSAGGGKGCVVGGGVVIKNPTH